MSDIKSPSGEIPIVIVGTGPVALTMSLELSRLGVRHVALGEELTTARHPKANHIAARSMETFRKLGLSGQVRLGGLPADYPCDVVYLTRLNGIEIARFKLPSRNQVVQAANEGHAFQWQTPEHPHRISQIFLEKMLFDAAVASPYADIRLGWRVTEIEEAADHVAISVIETESGEPHSIRARYVVGADGARSIARDSIGAQFVGDKVRRTFLGGSTLAVYFESADLQGILKGKEGLLYQTFNPELRSGGFSINGADRFVFHFQVPEGSDPDSIDERPLLTKIVGRDFEYNLLSRITWTAGLALVVDKMATDRIFLAGDAAHLFTPTGGFGLNTGIDEASNLSWKLAAAVQGWGSDALLATYASERRPVAVRNVKAASQIADRLVGLQIPADIEEKSARGDSSRAAVADVIQDVVRQEAVTQGVQLGVRYEGSPIIIPDGTPPTEDDPTIYIPTARPGSRLPHVMLSDGPIFDKLAVGFTLLCLGVDGPTDEQLSGIEAPLTVKSIDQDGVADFYQARYVLVRPDQHVAWRGQDLPADLRAIVRTACRLGASDAETQGPGDPHRLETAS